MSDVNDLIARIDGAITGLKDKVKKSQQEQLKEFTDRKKLLQQFEVVQAKLVELTKPRLQALAQRAGDRVKVTPKVSESRRSGTLEFRSPKAYITLTFAIAPDPAIQNAVAEYDLQVVPVLWKFDSNSEFRTPIAKPDEGAYVKWLDDRILAFVSLFLQIHEDEFLDKAEYVEDPIAKVKFPKFAAGAQLDHGGQTHYFIDAASKAEFAKQKGIPG